jgi:hypothetical protein
MNTNARTTKLPAILSINGFIPQVIVLFVIGYSQLTLAQQASEKTVASANQAAQALYEAVTNKDEGAVVSILGAAPELTSSGDATIDKLEHEQFAKKYREMHRLVREPDGNTVLYIGAENWPFPIPLVARNSQWRFDPNAGAQEIAARRIGENERLAIEVCQDLGAAVYASADQKMQSDPAFQFAFELASNSQDADHSFHGYNFRIGSEQAVGVVLVAYPAEYGASGVMTFIVVPGGSVYEKDLGAETANLAPQINGKPTGNWAPVQ